MGEVCLAEDAKLSRKVAFNCLPAIPQRDKGLFDGPAYQARHKRCDHTVD
jgi:hypothetical protein